MASFNQVILLGNLTRDPEVRHTPKGTACAEIGLAVNRRFTSGDQVRDEVTFVDITAWGRQAEVIGQYCKKGHPLFVQGRLQLDQWDDKQTGQKRSKMRVVLEQFQFIATGDRTDNAGGQRGSAPPPEPPAGHVDEDQIPF